MTSPVQPDTPGFDALRARLAATLRSQIDPRVILQNTSAQLRSADWLTWMEYARAFSSVGAPALAAGLLGEATRRWPLNPELQVGWGHALHLSQRNAQAEATFREVLRMHPDHEQAALALAFMLRQCGRIDAACAVALELWQRQGKGVEATLKAAVFFEECRRPQLVAQVYRTALAEGARDPRLHAAYGDVLTALGQFETGREHLLAALDAGLELKDWSGIFMRLATGQRYADFSHPDFGRFEQAWADLALTEDVRIAAGYALGKARIDIGDIPGAVEVLGPANAMEHRSRPWDGSAFSDFVATQIAAPLPPPIVPADAFEDVIPVFVVGLPRTGTTLVEEMLTRHPMVRGRGEMDWLPFLAFELSAQQRANDPLALRQAASIYLAQLRQDDAPARWYIDKNPHNFRYLGLIASLFPQARIIHCVRNRRDTAVSIWCQLFAHRDTGYANDLGDIAAFGQGHDRLMRHWRDRLEMRIFEVAYESMVEQPDAMVRQLCGFLGLPAQEIAGSAPTGGGAITTASVWQARQPVHRGSVGRWRQFEPYLLELSRWLGTTDSA